MNSIIEKITMYDILGYLVPGTLFWVLGVSGKVLELISNGMIQNDTMGDYSAVLWVAVTVVAYAAGIALSEVMRWVCLVCGWVASPLCKINFLVLIWEKMKAFFKIESVENRLTQQIKQALEKGHYLSAEDRDGNWTVDDVKKYYKIMYADIQADEKYSRLHSYASSEVFYKNLAAATAAGVAVDICVFGGGYGGIIALGRERAIACILVIAFLVRYKRFEKKKMQYTLSWFVEKYTGREASAN
jgi:type IV secretory pathway VirB3-like protein